MLTLHCDRQPDKPAAGDDGVDELEEEAINDNSASIIATEQDGPLGIGQHSVSLWEK